MGCNLCNAGNYGARWTAELNLGTKKVSNAAIEFNMTVEEVLTHINEHESKTETVDVIELLNDPDFIKREVIMMHIRLKEWLAFMMEAEEFGTHNMDRGMKLLKETRETLKLLAELEGKFSRGNQFQVKYIEAQNDLRMVTSAIVENACPHCRSLLIGKIKEQKALLGAGNASGSSKED
jgi:hypothetical protein